MECLRWLSTCVVVGLWLAYTLSQVRKPAPKQRECAPQPLLVECTELSALEHQVASLKAQLRSHELEPHYGPDGLLERNRSHPISALPAHVQAYAHESGESVLAYADFEHEFPKREGVLSIYLINDGEADSSFRMTTSREFVLAEPQLRKSKSRWERPERWRLPPCRTAFPDYRLAPHTFVRVETRVPSVGAKGTARFRIVSFEQSLTTNAGPVRMGKPWPWREHEQAQPDELEKASDRAAPPP